MGKWTFIFSDIIVIYDSWKVRAWGCLQALEDRRQVSLPPCTRLKLPHAAGRASACCREGKSAAPKKQGRGIRWPGSLETSRDSKNWATWRVWDVKEKKKDLRPELSPVEPFLQINLTADPSKVDVRQRGKSNSNWTPKLESQPERVDLRDLGTWQRSEASKGSARNPQGVSEIRRNAE